MRYLAILRPFHRSALLSGLDTPSLVSSYSTVDSIRRSSIDSERQPLYSYQRSPFRSSQPVWKALDDDGFAKESKSAKKNGSTDNVGRIVNILVGNTELTENTKSTENTQFAEKTKDTWDAEASNDTDTSNADAVEKSESPDLRSRLHERLDEVQTGSHLALSLIEHCILNEAHEARMSVKDMKTPEHKLDKIVKDLERALERLKFVAQEFEDGTVFIDFSE